MDNLIEYLFCLLDFYLLEILCSIYYKSMKYSRYKAFLIGILSFFLLIVSKSNLPITDLLNFVLLYLYVYLVYKKGNKKIVLAFIYYAFNGVFTIFLLTMISFVTVNELSNFYVPNTFTRILFVLFSRILIYFILLLISKKKNKIVQPSQITSNYVIIFFITCIMLMIVLNIAIKRNENIFVITDILIITIALIVMIMCIFKTFSLYAHSKEKITEYEKELLIKSIEKEYYLKSLEKNSEILHLKHDIKNQLTSLKYLLEEGKNGDAIHYLEAISNNEALKKIDYSNCLILNAILNSKMTENPDIQFAVHIDANDIKISDIDLTVILGNAIDNAVEAVRNLDDEIRHIEVTVKREKNLLYVKVVNKAKGILLDRKGNLLTTKTDRKYHNIGMLSMKKVTDKYNGKVQFDFSNTIFTLEIFIFE